MICSEGGDDEGEGGGEITVIDRGGRVLRSLYLVGTGGALFNVMGEGKEMASKGKGIVSVTVVGGGKSSSMLGEGGGARDRRWRLAAISWNMLVFWVL